MTSEYVEPFEQGYLAGDLANNPHTLTSNYSDAFVLGVWFTNREWPSTVDIRKSRGYEWVACGVRFRVDGTVVEVLEGVPDHIVSAPRQEYTAEKLKLATKGRATPEVDQKSICGLPLFEPELDL